jgi:hypothetical protein
MELKVAILILPEIAYQQQNSCKSIKPFSISYKKKKLTHINNKLTFTAFNIVQSKPLNLKKIK